MKEIRKVPKYGSIAGCLEPITTDNVTRYRECHYWADVAYYLEFGHLPGVLSGWKPRAGQSMGNKAIWGAGYGKKYVKPRRAARFALEFAAELSIMPMHIGLNPRFVGWVDRHTEEPVRFVGKFKICDLRGHEPEPGSGECVLCGE